MAPKQFIDGTFPLYDSKTPYDKNSIVRSGNVHYKSLKALHTDKAIGNVNYWKPLFFPPCLILSVYVKDAKKPPDEQEECGVLLDDLIKNVCKSYSKLKPDEPYSPDDSYCFYRKNFEIAEFETPFKDVWIQFAKSFTQQLGFGYLYLEDAAQTCIKKPYLWISPKISFLNALMNKPGIYEQSGFEELTYDEFNVLSDWSKYHEITNSIKKNEVSITELIEKRDQAKTVKIKESAQEKITKLEQAINENKKTLKIIKDNYEKGPKFYKELKKVSSEIVTAEFMLDVINLFMYRNYRGIAILRNKQLFNKGFNKFGDWLQQYEYIKLNKKHASNYYRALFEDKDGNIGFVFEDDGFDFTDFPKSMIKFLERLEVHLMMKNRIQPIFWRVFKIFLNKISKNKQAFNILSNDVKEKGLQGNGKAIIFLFISEFGKPSSEELKSIKEDSFSEEYEQHLKDIVRLNGLNNQEAKEAIKNEYANEFLKNLLKYLKEKKEGNKALKIVLGKFKGEINGYDGLETMFRYFAYVAYNAGVENPFDDMTIQDFFKKFNTRIQKPYSEVRSPLFFTESYLNVGIFEAVLTNYLYVSTMEIMKSDYNVRYYLSLDGVDDDDDSFAFKTTEENVGHYRQLNDVVANFLDDKNYLV
jgi:hypothetical protein